MSRLVSIVVDNFDQGRFLAAAIDSALAQRGAPIEVIVVDDGSRDGSREVIARYGDAIVPVLKPNGGQASALNAGFARSRGDVVIFLDADDALLPDAARRALACFDDPRVVKAHWPMAVIDEAGASTGARHPEGRLPDGDRRASLLRNGPTSELAPPTSGNAWSRAFLASALPIPEELYRISADKHLLEIAPFAGSLVRVDEPLSLYRRHGAGSQLSLRVEERLALELRFWDSYVDAIERRLAADGVAVDRDAWRSRSWWHLQAQAIRELESLPDARGPLVLVDDGAWGRGPVAGRETLPFLERDGVYWGSPADDATAVAELERMRDGGAAAIAFVWSTFWWLDHYGGLCAHLERGYPCALSSPRVVAFDLTQPKRSGDA